MCIRILYPFGRAIFTTCSILATFSCSIPYIPDLTNTCYNIRVKINKATEIKCYLHKIMTNKLLFTMFAISGRLSVFSDWQASEFKITSSVRVFSVFIWWSTTANLNIARGPGSRILLMPRGQYYLCIVLDQKLFETAGKIINKQSADNSAGVPTMPRERSR